MAAIYMPFEPLEEIVLPRVEADDEGKRPDGKMGAACGVSGRAWARWRSEGQIPWASADLAATNMKYQPFQIWGDDWEDLDRGLLEGTDRKAMRAVSKAMEKIGEVLAAEAHAQRVANGEAYSEDLREHELICQILDASTRPKAVC